MRKTGLLTAAFALVFFAASCGETNEQPKNSGEPENMMIIETNLGTITCELFPDKAPMTVDVISGLADGSREWTHPETGQTMTATPYYDGVVFHPGYSQFHDTDRRSDRVRTRRTGIPVRR